MPTWRSKFPELLANKKAEWAENLYPHLTSSHTHMCVYTINLRSCASCAYWGGPRRALKRKAEIDVDRYTIGPCVHVNRRGVQCSENAICQDYIRWSVIDNESIEIITG